MLTECRSCGDPLFEYLPACRRCGQPNVDYVPDKRPTAAATHDQQAEALLLGVGVLGAVAGPLARLVRPLTDPVADAIARIGWLPAVLIGLGFLIAYHRLDVGDLASGAKKRLWLIIYLGTAVVGLVCWAAFQ